jgi:hypothetical protein
LKRRGSSIAVRLAFGVFPLPGLVIGATDDRIEIPLFGLVTDPSGGTTSLHHDQVKFAVIEQVINVRSPGGDGLEAVFAAFGVGR